MDISLAHTHRSATIAQPIPIRTRRGAPNWCAVIGLCVRQSRYATTISHVRLEFWFMWIVNFVRTYALM